jgi:hypothetical protein
MNLSIRLANPIRIPRRLPHLAVLFLLPGSFHGADLPTVTGIEAQPLVAQVRRLSEALDLAGAPLKADEKAALDSAAKLTDADAASAKIQAVLDPHCVVGVTINPEMRVKVVPGPAKDELAEQGWSTFLVKVANQAGTTAPLNVVSPQAQSVFSGVRPGRSPSDQHFRQNNTIEPINATDLWLDLQTFDKSPLKPALSGLGLEYRIVSLYSRDAGKREATLSFDVGQGTQDLGFRSDTPILFTAAPAREITLRVRDEHGAPTTASFIIRDAVQRVYPSTAKRLAPDFGFQPQIYRADGDKLRLPDGEYTIQFNRGPESIPEVRTVRVNADTHELAFQVDRWIDPAKLGWWSGDHHIHAAGCAHYTNPTEGVLPQDMMRHCLGEDLKVGCNLTWGPCFDYQKQFFTGHEDKVSQFPYVLRYDIEVSGFGSHQSGHLCLLRLRDQMYPGGTSDKHWPTLGLNTLRWAKAQGALVGPAHSGWGLQPMAENDPRRNEPGARNMQSATDQVPNYIIPPFSGIGANEYIVDVTHELPGPDGKPTPAVDFMSMVDTPYPWEMNIWYHTLNVGFRTRISGETDFPCIYGERVGLGRSYVKLPEKWSYEDWCEGIRAGRNYVSDGFSHLLDFQVNDVKVGERGSELRLATPGTVHIVARVAARLNETPNEAIGHSSTSHPPYWNIERARVGDTREVAVEVIVNGQSVATKRIVADGKLQDISFDTPIDHSSWVALRILASSHTNPVFVLVGDKPIRASKRSAEWCRKSVDQCWSQKQRTYAEAEQADAEKAYQHARQTYDRLITECLAD